MRFIHSSPPEKQSPCGEMHLSLQSSTITQMIRACVFGKCTSAVGHSAKARVQEVTSASVPDSDKTDIPTKPFPKTNKQNLPMCACSCLIPSTPRDGMIEFLQMKHKVTTAEDNKEKHTFNMRKTMRKRKQ